jgi:hypothetical protein
LAIGGVHLVVGLLVAGLQIGNDWWPKFTVCDRADTLRPEPVREVGHMRSAVSMRVAAFAAFSMMLLPGGGMAQTYLVHRVEAGSAKGYEDIHISKAALAGQQVRIWTAMLLNPDCSPAGTMTTQILEQPRHGQVSISDGQIYPSFVPPNPRAACNAHRAPGKQAFYTPDARFHGHDKLVLQNATSEGRMRRIIVDVDVR